MRLTPPTRPVVDSALSRTDLESKCSAFPRRHCRKLCLPCRDVAQLRRVIHEDKITPRWRVVNRKLSELFLHFSVDFSIITHYHLDAGGDQATAKPNNEDTMDTQIKATETGSNLPYMLASALGSIGWELRRLDIDASTGEAVITVRHHALLVTLYADRLGRASVERENLVTRTELVGRRGDRFPAECLGTEFVGRQRFEGVRSAMRGLADYIADNSNVPRIEARAWFRPLLARELP